MQKIKQKTFSKNNENKKNYKNKKKNLKTNFVQTITFCF